MIRDWCRGIAQIAAVLLYLNAMGSAHAQRASENALKEADDAFGTTVGVERTGIYDQDDTRGFSPKQAGNARIEGLYFDQVASLSGRLQQSTSIRVGFAAEDFPFPAPTGVVDDRLHPMPKQAGVSLGLHRTAYWGNMEEVDIRLPVIADHFGIVGGVGRADYRMTDGSRSLSHDFAVRAVARFARSEFSPFLAMRWFPENLAPTLVVVRDDFLPEKPRERLYLSQKWANPEFDNITAGATFKSRLTEHFVIRSGLFHSGGKRIRNFVEIYSLTARTGPDNATHVMIADPLQDVHSTSGEVQAVWLNSGDRWAHRIYLGYRARDRKTEFGGSDIVNFGTATYGVPDPQAEQDFEFTEVNVGRIRQSSAMLGYIGKLRNRVTINLGIQKARYRANARDGVSGNVSRSSDDPWLYNATLDVDVLPFLSVYAGTQRGLEDSGSAPENAANARSQLPSTRTTQYEGGVRWKFGHGHLVVNAFEITKPYFSFDSDNVYTRIGTVRHRGVETSISAHLWKRLDILAGAVIMKPRVSGEARDAGLIGNRPAGTPSLNLRMDANYKTDLLGGITPTLAITYLGKRAVGARPLESLDGGQLMVPSFTRVDIGLRRQFELGKVKASLRAKVNNVLDEQNWDVVAANTLKLDDRRRFILTLTADF